MVEVPAGAVEVVGGPDLPGEEAESDGEAVGLGVGEAVGFEFGEGGPGDAERCL